MDQLARVANRHGGPWRDGKVGPALDIGTRLALA